MNIANVVNITEGDVQKRHNWSTKGGHVAPIFVPPTPNSELASILKEVVDREAEAGVSFKIVETSGITVKTVLQMSNPTATPGCTDVECLACRQGTLGLSGSTHFFDCPRKRFNRCFQGPLYEKDTKEIEMIPLANFEK